MCSWRKTKIIEVFISNEIVVIMLRIRNRKLETTILLTGRETMTEREREWVKGV